MNAMKYIPYQDNIFSLFHAALLRDKEHFIRNWMVTWQYQEKREQRKVKYPEDYDQDFHVYKGRVTLCNGSTGFLFRQNQII
jgi:hypothetical protein